MFIPIFSNNIEFVEIYYLTVGGMLNNFVVMSTGISAYFVAGHIAAKNFPRTIAVSMSLIYSLFLFGPLTAYYARYEAANSIVREYYLAYPEGWAMPQITFLFQWSGIGILTVIGPIPLFWLASIYYVHFYVRRTTNS